MKPWFHWETAVYWRYCGQTGCPKNSCARTCLLDLAFSILYAECTDICISSLSSWQSHMIYRIWKFVQENFLWVKSKNSISCFFGKKKYSSEISWLNYTLEPVGSGRGQKHKFKIFPSFKAHNTWNSFIGLVCWYHI